VIRIVDLTEQLNYRACAFFDTITDRFLENAMGSHDFKEEDVAEHARSARLRMLVPQGFWKKPTRFIVVSKPEEDTITPLNEEVDGFIPNALGTYILRVDITPR
jgi:hypothetical protein